ncbi:MAG: chitobiase/beta-hexosaminidase C-terminal domain-containing protein [Marinilabiliales bacterium]|nr:chitobiase/beta-hexosaminidase C-terminal domain-containing protein [Marinilabiliales bacterium]
MEYNYSKGSWKVDILPEMVSGAFKVVLESEQPGVPIHYTADGSDPFEGSPVYKEPFVISKSTVIKAGLFVDGKLKEYASEKSLNFHKALGKTGKLAEPPSKNYYAGGAMSLTDGMTGSGNFKDGYWLGFEGTDMDFEVDLGEEIAVSAIRVNFFQNTGSWIFMPLKVQFVVFDKDLKQVATAESLPETNHGV